jgi:hypothetical protein
LFTCIALLLLGVGSIVAGFHGDMSVNFGSSLASNSFHLRGDTTGGFAILGILGILAAILMLMITMLAMAKDWVKPQRHRASGD